MKGERSRRTRADKLGLGRNQRSGAGKGRLRVARRERKLFARADLTQTPEATESAAEASPGAPAKPVTEARVSQHTPAREPKEVAPEQSHRSQAAPRDRVAAKERIVEATEPSGSAGPKNASAGASGRTARGRKAKADPMGERAAMQAAPETKTGAAPTTVPGGGGRRQWAGGDAARSSANRKAMRPASNGRKKTVADAVAATSTDTAPDSAAAQVADNAAPAARPRRPRKASHPAAARSTARSAAPATGMSAGQSPARSDSQSEWLGASRPGPGAAASGTMVSATAVPAGNGSSGPSASLSLHLASDAFALAQEAAEIGAAALLDVAAARSLPQLIEAQLRCGRAASAIWMRQLRIATSIFPVPTGSR